MKTDEELAKLYRTGLSLKLLGAEMGLSDFAIRYRLKRFYGSRRYFNAVTKVLLHRVTHARGRALKHAIAMLRQKRPALYAQFLERTKPATCSGCARPIAAELRSMWWRWQCAWCGASDRVPAIPSHD